MEEHPISLEKAKGLLTGDLGDVYRGILAGCCVPIFWFDVDAKDVTIAHNGTLTIAKTPKLTLGITAAHVMRQYESDQQKGKFRVQLMDQVFDSLLDHVIDVSDKQDIATIEIDEPLLKRIAKTPLGMWPPKPPEEGKGIMISGYPGVERLQQKALGINWGLFTVLGIARTVTEKQITWLFEREFQVPDAKIPPPPPEYDLGGISGGPLISWFESKSALAHHCLSGIVIEHPDYKNNKDMAPIERLIAVRVDSITESGKII